MRFFAAKKYDENVFNAEDELEETIIQQPLQNGWIMLSRASSTASTSDLSDFLTQDPMHDADKNLSPKPKPLCASLARSIDSAALESLEVGEVTVDEEGNDWVVRQCFCENSACPGKAFWRVDGKDELDVWDRGRPKPDE